MHAFEHKVLRCSDEFLLLRALPPQSRKTISFSCSFSFSIIWSVKVVQPRFLWLFASPTAYGQSRGSA